MYHTEIFLDGRLCCYLKRYRVCLFKHTVYMSADYNDVDIKLYTSFRFFIYEFVNLLISRNENG